MQGIEVDWAGDEAPETGVVFGGEGEGVVVVVELVVERGPAAGWPVYAVVAIAGEGVPAYREAMALDAWLADVYGVDDEDERQALLDA